MFCSKCGIQLVEGTKFCNKCGAAKKEAAVKTITPQKKPAASTVRSQTKSSKKNSPRFRQEHGLVRSSGLGPENNFNPSTGALPKSGATKRIVTGIALVSFFLALYFGLGFSPGFFSTSGSQYNRATELMNNNQLVYAARIFRSLGDFRDSYAHLAAIIPLVYEEGITLYRRGNIDAAEVAFTETETFGRTADFMTLIQARRGVIYGNGIGLLNLLYFEDTREIITENNILFFRFLGYDNLWNLDRHWHESIYHLTFFTSQNGSEALQFNFPGSAGQSAIWNGRHYIDSVFAWEYTIISRNEIRIDHHIGGTFTLNRSSLAASPEIGTWLISDRDVERVFVAPARRGAAAAESGFFGGLWGGITGAIETWAGGGRLRDGFFEGAVGGAIEGAIEGAFGAQGSFNYASINTPFAFSLEPDFTGFVIFLTGLESYVTRPITWRFESAGSVVIVTDNGLVSRFRLAGNNTFNGTFGGNQAVTYIRGSGN